MALDEEAGRSQVNSLPVFSDKAFSSRVASFAMLHSHCRGAPRSFGADWGVLGSAGAALCLQTCEIAATVQILAFLFPGF
jgi:hypothetical protein